MTNPINESSRVSVVIPVYNGAATIDRALNSVLAQSIADIKIFVVDDGSIDDSAALIQAHTDPRITLLQQINRGVGAARNRGIEAASTEWVAFLDCDDEWDPDFLDTVLNIVDAYPECAVAATGYRFKHASGNVEELVIPDLPSQPWEGVMDSYFKWAARSYPPICSSAVMVRKEALDSIEGFAEGVPIGEDLVTWANLALNHSVAYSSAPHATYWEPFYADGSPKRKPSPNDLIGAEFRKLYQQFPKTKGLKAYLGFWFKVRAWQCSRFGMEQETLAASLTALRYRPLHLRVIAYYLISVLPEWVRSRVTRNRH
jgi:glycosyltransferase involved in cell wall biosynthesis